jgi:hypothetical protein
MSSAYRTVVAGVATFVSVHLSGRHSHATIHVGALQLTHDESFEAVDVAHGALAHEEAHAEAQHDPVGGNVPRTRLEGGSRAPGIEPSGEAEPAGMEAASGATTANTEEEEAPSHVAEHAVLEVARAQVPAHSGETNRALDGEAGPPGVHQAPLQQTSPTNKSSPLIEEVGGLLIVPEGQRVAPPQGDELYAAQRLVLLLACIAPVALWCLYQLRSRRVHVTPTWADAAVARQASEEAASDERGRESPTANGGALPRTSPFHAEKIGLLAPMLLSSSPPAPAWPLRECLSSAGSSGGRPRLPGSRSLLSRRDMTPSTAGVAMSTAGNHYALSQTPPVARLATHLAASRGGAAPRGSRGGAGIAIHGLACAHRSPRVDTSLRNRSR